MLVFRNFNQLINQLRSENYWVAVTQVVLFQEGIEGNRLIRSESDSKINVETSDFIRKLCVLQKDLCTPPQEPYNQT